ILVCPDDVTHRKPHPEPMWLACSTIKCEPTRTIYVGDHVRDIEAGRAAGMYTVAARYGYLSSPDEALAWAADMMIDHPDELLDWVQQEKISLHTKCEAEVAGIHPDGIIDQSAPTVFQCGRACFTPARLLIC